MGPRPAPEVPATRAGPPFSSQLPDFVQSYPEHVGATIPASDGLTLNLHALNGGSTPVTAKLLVTMHVAKPGIITQHVGVLYLEQTNLTSPPLDIPPGVHTATASYVVAAVTSSSASPPPPT